MPINMVFAANYWLIKEISLVQSKIIDYSKIKEIWIKEICQLLNHNRHFCLSNSHK